MPVTAKLSRRFYEMFGDEVANELVEWFNAMDATYRADLRELNEPNLQRFDAALEQRIAKLELRIAELPYLRTDFESGFRQFTWSLVRWMFGFWIATLAPLAGLVIYLSR